MNDLNALNRMLTVKFKFANERNDVPLRSVAQRDSIGSVHELIFNNQSVAQRDHTVL